MNEWSPWEAWHPIIVEDGWIAAWPWRRVKVLRKAVMYVDGLWATDDGPYWVYRRAEKTQ